MPLALALLGLLSIVIGIRDKGPEARGLLLSELTGPGNFLAWALAIILMGALGYVPRLQGLSRGLLMLTLVSLILSKRGAIGKLPDQVLNRTARQPAEGSDPAPVGGGGGSAPAAPASPSRTVLPDTPAPGAGSYPAGVGSGAWWAQGLPPATGAQAACPPGTRAVSPLGWSGGITRCVPS